MSANAMPLREHVQELISLVEAGRSVDAIDRFYADDVVVFENHELARAGRVACLAFERDAVARLLEPAHSRALALACDEPTARAFIEWQIRFRTADGRWMRMEEVAVQRWSGDRIVEERFYYEGVIDEGDEDDGDATLV
jgi:ketosteroid isomerase-like protein